MSVTVNVVGQTAVSVSVASQSAASVSVAASTGASVVASGGIGPAGFITVPGTATSAFGTFQIAPGNGITVSTADGQFLISSYPSTTVSSLAPVQSVAGRTGTILLQASDVTAGTFAIGRIPTIGYTALSGVPTAFSVIGHTHDASDVASGVLSIARIPVISYTALSNVPASSGLQAHTHSTTDIVAFTSAASAAAPVQSVQSRTGAVVLTRADITAAAEVHTHSTADVVGLTAAFSQVGHTHAASDVTSGVLNIARIPTISYTALSDVPSSFNPIAHTHLTTDVVAFTAAASAAAPVQSVAGRTGTVTLTKSDVGLGNVDNTSDASKPVSTAQAAADAAVQAFAIQRTNHTGTQAASTISDFATEAAKYGPVTSVAGRTGTVTLSTSDISGLQTALDGKQIAGNYVTAVNDLYGGVKLAAGANIAITASSQTITITSTGLGKNDSVDCGFFYGVSSPTIFITQQPSSQTASSGSANFSVSAYVTHDGLLSYQWQRKKAGGITWTQRTLPASIDWKSIAYGNGRFVAVGYGAGGGNGSIAATSTDGINWTQEAMPASREWAFVTYGNGLFLAITKGTDAATSTDGRTWTSQYLPNGVEWSSVTYGNGRFVAIADGLPSGNNVAATSTNGSSWTQRTLPADALWTGVAYGNDTFVAVSQLSSDVAATSPDGVTWTQRTMPFAREWSSIAFGNGLFVAVDYYGARAARSTDGVSWAESSMPGTGWTYVTYGDDAFFAVAFTGTQQGYVARSTDGITWTVHSLSGGTRYTSIAYGGGMYAAISTNSSRTSSIASSSPDSAPYADVSNATSSALSLTGLTGSTDNLDRYRVTLTSDVAPSVTSSAVTLKVS